MNTLETTPAHYEKPVDDYLRVMTISPEVAIADPAANTERILACYEEAKQSQAELVALPELSVTGYSTADLFFNRLVLERAEKALAVLAEATKDGPAMVVGSPVEDNGILYNCGVMLAGGKIAGAVPKSYLPNYSEFYEKRWFTSGRDVKEAQVRIAGHDVPFGTDLLFELNGAKVAVEVCEDLFAPIPPSSIHALAGADVIVNVSASNEVIGKPDYRRNLVTGTAARLICAYVYASAGKGESTADTVYGGHQIISELGRLSGEVEPLNQDNGKLVYDIDKTYIEHDRLVNKTFADQASEYRQDYRYRVVELDAPKPTDGILNRTIEAEAYLPRDQAELDARCEYMFDIMAGGFVQRIAEINSNGIVLGLSGGLDSTLALLTAIRASELLHVSNDFVHTATMPGPASSDRTQNNAGELAAALGTTHRTMEISELAAGALESIGHDGLTQDIPYENTQARMRTLLLMNYANKIGGIVEGTGDMSESSQGFCTYNGDHMSMYNPNAGIPKTLIRHLVRWYADHRATNDVRQILLDILDTPISPELTGNGDLTQTTEEVVGPYALIDFFDKEQNRYGSRPEKIGYLAGIAFKDTFDLGTIEHWRQSYFKRFTASQWKREAIPNGPKLGTVSLSPRTDLRMAPNTSPDWYK